MAPNVVLTVTLIEPLNVLSTLVGHSSPGLPTIRSRDSGCSRTGLRPASSFCDFVALGTRDRVTRVELVPFKFLIFLPGVTYTEEESHDP
jgi:hypothetical protein